MTVDRLAQRVARRHDPGVLAFLRRQLQPSRGDRAGDVVGFDLGDVRPKLLEGASDIALEARLDRFLQRRIALAHDLVHGRGLEPRALELGERLAGIHGIELLRVADQHDARDADFVRDAQQVPGLRGRGERALVDHQDGLREGRPHLAGALLGEPARRDTGIAREEQLQGLALDAGFFRERLHRRGRGREPQHTVALLSGEHPRPVEHRGLAGAGIALDADRPVLRRQDQLHRILLTRRERPLVEIALDRPAPHRRASLSLSPNA